MKRNPTLIILMVIMLVNALSYGTIIPLLYPYAARFGINPLGLSLLFASFSLAQLLATPIIGRLSDKYGRKPLLLLCLAGTAVSLALFASATSALMLFVSRILDGITGGNISVAQAVLADTTEGKDRAQAFGLLGAAFGFGFLFGPALGGLLSQISLSAPFWFAAALALGGTLAGTFMLKETLDKSKRQPAKQPFFSLHGLTEALTNPLTGIILVISFLFMTALNAWIIGFQTFSNDILKLPARDIGLMFATFGFISIVIQGWGIRVLLNKFKHKKSILVGSLLFSILIVAPTFFIHSFVPFFVLVLLFGITSTPMNPVITGLLSERTKAEDQGGILGINQSIVSFGQIVGPLIAGTIATTSVNAVFPVAAAIMVAALVATKWLYIPKVMPVNL
ncbi:TPA: MFS transporter [Patescibacteria group bacterium]|uniref:Major facilitator superfamily transporter n=1 Tax=Candidatus Gottesmanbacteria bacterium GW2011_GWA1_43_11 TaxID=1618436 RepID=A0A0G1CDD9_9BACT|nr:MAG: Major facilitator superfamily transporter [Candidatus Gottesmanbacteria bacterium GW2011_GWA1_43_11]HCS79334.1 MFS transporter [Patescibacteria group bacterium]